MRTGVVAELPVAVDLPPALELEVTLYVEQEVGWRRVPPDGPPAPALLLTQRARPWPPCVVIVEGSPDGGTVRDAWGHGAVDVIGWPEERERLASCAARVLPARPVAAPQRLVVAGAAGGVGASTVALALGGLAAWGRRRVAVVGGAGLLRLAGVRSWPGPGADELDRLAPADAAREFPRVAAAAPGVPGLWLLPATRVPEGHGWPVDLVVIDIAAPWAAAAVAVARPDASVERLAEYAGPVAMVGAGPRSAAEVRRLLGRPPAAWLPASSRVARAGCLGRVPASLPGSYLAALRRVWTVAG